MKRLFLAFLFLASFFQARADGYAVGEIPYEVGVSPSGGRTISVPIMTAPCRGTVPGVSICYSSQGGDGVAGFGWDIGGLSSITLAPKTMYYDGTVGEPDPSLPSSQVFALDGVRLVDNLESYDFPDYDYVTVQGRIFIQKVVSSNGEIVCFDALLPDGSRRRYGFSNNTSTKLTYPLTESIDPLGYYIKYTYVESGNRYYPTSIRYGSQNSSSLPSEIRFSYDTRRRSEEMFISGHQVLLSKLLASITSYNDGQVLRNYSFSHRLSGREMCLSQIDCSAPDGSALNPLFFSYGQTGADRGLVTERQMTLWSYPSGTGNRFRGKFLPQSYSDGLIAYTDGYPTYGIIQGDESAGDDLQFGSLFPANGIICVYKSLDTSALPYQITAGTGFQVAGAADIDGDGVDEMVKVNFGVFDEEESTLDITVFHFNESQTPSSYFGDVSVSGTVQDGDYYSPMSRSYFFGDFLGNGKTQLLSVAHSFNGYFGGTACFALIDLESLSIISETPMPLVYISPDTEDRFAAVDMDGDGRTELYNMMTADVYGISSTGAFSLKDNWGSAQGIFPRNRCFFGDVNGDGLPDIVAAPANSSPTYQNVFLPVWVPHVCPYCIQDEPIISSGSRICRHCGRDLFAYFLEDLPTKGRCYKCSAILSDMREDETYDQDEIDIDNCLFCHDHGFTFSRAIENIPTSAKTWTVYKNNGKQFVSSTQQLIPVISGDSFQLMDLDRDGKMDLLRYRNGQFALFLNRSGQFASVPAGTLPVNGIPAGLGFQTMNAFGASHVILLTGSQVSTLSYGDFDSCLMTGVTDSFGNQTVSKYCTAYDSSGSYHPTSATVTFPFCQTFLPLTLVSESMMYMDGRSSPIGNNHFDYYGAVISRDGRGFRGFERTVERDSIRNRSTDMYYNPTLCVLTDLSTNTGHNSYIYSRQVFPNKEERILLLSEEDEDLLKGIISRKTYTYDIHGYPLSIEESRCFDTEEDETSEESTQMTYCHYFDQEEYVMGLVTSRSITRSKHQSDTVSWTERDDYSYDYDTKKIDQRIHYVCNGSDSEVSRTRWTYDSYGNPLTERTSVYGATGYVGKTFTYGSGGRTLASETDALGLTTTFSGYDRFGHPASSTDHLGRTTTYSYDSFGQLLKTVFPDGTVDSTAVAWGGKGKYTVSHCVSGAPTQVTHFDALSREVRREEQCFNGAWRKVDREYDSFGRPYRESLPFRETSPLYWAVHTYDAYDRPTGVLEPSGKETTWTYGSAQSYSVTRVEDGIQTQSFIDASGSVTMVVDGGGTISYDIRPDGQPSSVSVTGGGVT
ncbi:MAG: hypothetical protein IJR77_03585, partial [Bacteroidales bacterium]|nr:hypothetical protein [Bacteroidales bacterium]